SPTGASSSSAQTGASSRFRPRRPSTGRGASAPSPGARRRLRPASDRSSSRSSTGAERERVAYDLVVVAIGFDARWFEALLGARGGAAGGGGAGGGRAGTEHRLCPLDARAEPANASAGAGRAGTGARLPHLELSRPAQRPSPAPLCPARGAIPGDVSERRE